MKNFKAILCVALLICCGLMFAACGNKDKTPAKTGFDVTTADGQTTHVTTWKQATTNLTGGETITLFEDVELNDMFTINVNLIIDGNNHSIKANQNFNLNLDKPTKEKTRNVLVVDNSNIMVTLKNLTIDANNKCRVLALTKGELTLDNVLIKNGLISNENAAEDNFYTAGLFAANYTKLNIKNASFENNKLSSDLTTKEVYFVKNSVDLFIGAKAECNILNINVDSVFVNAYNTNYGKLTLNGGLIQNLYLEYANKGAELEYINGSITNLKISTTTEGVIFEDVIAQKGNLYTAGSNQPTSLLEVE